MQAEKGSRKVGIEMGKGGMGQDASLDILVQNMVEIQMDFSFKRKSKHRL